MKYACRPSLGRKSPVPAPTSEPSATPTPCSTCRRSGNSPLPSAELLVGQCAPSARSRPSAPARASVAMHVVREHAARGRPGRAGGRCRGSRATPGNRSATVATSARFSLMCEVNQTSSPRQQLGAGVQDRVRGRQREPRGDGVPQPAPAVPALDQRAALGQRPARGGQQVVAQDPVADAPGPAVMLQPARARPPRTGRPSRWRSASRRPAPSSSRSASRPSRNSSATAAAYAVVGELASSGSAQRSSQSSSGMPSPPMARICG